MEGTSGFCRACLVKYDDPNDLIQYTEKNRRQFFYLTGIQVKKNDQFIFQLCNNCYQSLIVACKFKKLCRTSDKQYKQYETLNEAGVIRDFEKFLRSNESTFSYPSNNEFSTPIYKSSQDGDNASTCTSFRSFMTDLMKVDDDLPDTAYKIIEEVIQEEADIMDDSIDSEWLQEDPALPVDLNFDFSFSMFRSPCKVDTPQDTRFTSAENRTLDHQYVPYIPSLQPYTTDTNNTPQAKENNILSVKKETTAKSPLKISKMLRSCRKEAKKISVPKNKIKNEIVKLVETSVKELKVVNNESLNYDSTKEATENSTRHTESTNKTGNIKEESDAKANMYNLSKVKPKPKVKKHFEDYLHKNYVRRHGESRKTKRNKKNTNANKKNTKITKQKYINLSDSLSQRESNISENDMIKKRKKKNTNANKKNTKITKLNYVILKDSFQTDSLSPSEFNISENDMIPKAENSSSNNDILPLNQALTNNETNEDNLQSGAAIISDIETNEYSKLDSIPISYEKEPDKQSYDILNIGTYNNSEIVTDEFDAEFNVKSNKIYKIENIGTDPFFELNQNNDILNTGINQYSRVVDTKINNHSDIISLYEVPKDDLDNNIEMALRKSISNVIPLEDIFNPSVISIKSTATEQQETSPKKLGMQQYFENFIEEINSDNPLDNINTSKSITILENVKLKGPDDENIIEKFINDNKDSYSFSLEKLQHESIVEMVKIFDTVSRRCDMCNLNFISLRALKIHLCKIHKLKVLPDKKIRKKVINKKELLCLICGKMFACIIALKIHLKTHESKEEYTCDICNVSFTKKSAMKMHIIFHNPTNNKKSLTDTEEKDLRCNICGYKTKDKGKLILHKKRHKKSYKFQCQECTKQFLTEPEFIIHIRSHSGEKPFKCTVCPKNFARKDTLDAHVRKHTQSSARKKTSNAHIKKHDEKSVLKCPFCRKKYVMEKRLARHLENDKRCKELKRNEEKYGKRKEESQYNGIEIRFPDTELGELIIPDVSIPDLRQEVLLINPINYVEDEFSLNIFPQNNYEKEYVINPSFF